MDMRALILAVFIAASGPTFAGDIEIDVQNFTASKGISDLVLKITNNTGKSLEMIFVDCAFLDKNKRALAIGKAIISNVDAGGYAYDTASIARSQGVAHAECRVTDYH